MLQGGHLGPQPVVGRHLHQRQGVGVVEHAGQVDDQTRSGRPVDVHRRWAVEHAAQRVLEQLHQRHPQRRQRLRAIASGDSSDRCSWRASSSGSSPSMRARSGRIAGWPPRWAASRRSHGDRQQRLLDDRQVAAQHRAEHPGEQGLAGQQGELGITRTRIERVESFPAARRQPHRGHPQRVGQRPVLALRVGDGGEAAGPVEAGLPPHHHLRERRLAVARFADHQRVRVGQRHPGAESTPYSSNGS